MSIIQISKIQVRAGDLVDLPQLDEGEFGFANDQKRLFIGKTSPIENVEILTTYSSLAFSQITGANGANLSLSTFEDGQVLAIADNAGNVTVTNRGATKGGVINLGSVANVKMLGGSSGQAVITDGVGNLSFVSISAIVNPGGTNTQVQFNDNNDFGGNSGFTFDKTTGNFAVPSSISLGSSLTTTQTTFNLANATATTIQFGGDATAMAIGATGSTINFRGNINVDKSINFSDANGSNADTSVYYTNAGPEALVVALNNSSKMQIENGQSVLFGNVVVSSGNIDVTNTTFGIANANATTIQFGGDATAMAIGANGSTINFRGNIVVDKAINFLDANGSNADTSVYYTNAGPEALVVALNNSSKLQIENGQTVISEYLAVLDDIDTTGNLFVDQVANIVGNLNVTGKISYATGAGSTAVQAGARTNGVTINSKAGSITLVSAAGSATWTTFTVTNSFVTSVDTIVVNQKSGTDQYQIFVTNVSAGTFDITFATTGGTTTETPEFNFAILGGSIT